MTSLIKSALTVSADLRSHKKHPLKSLSALSLTVLLLAGGSVSAIAQSKAPSFSVDSKAQPVSSQLSESAQIEADIQQIVAQVMAAETAHWSYAQKAALKDMEALGLKDDELAAIAALTHSEMTTQLKSNPKLSKLSITGITSEEALKLAPALLLSRYLANIGRAALWGGVLSAIRSADFDYRAMSSALTSGNTREFMSLLRNGFTSDQARFTNLVGTAATFACGSATLEVSPRMCDRFASGMQKIFTRINRSNARSTDRSTTRLIRRRALSVAAPSEAVAKP